MLKQTNSLKAKNISDIVNLKVRIKQSQQENVRIQNLVGEVGKGNKSAVTELTKDIITNVW